MSAATADPASATSSSLPQPAFLVAAILTALGVACFFGGLATDPETTWRAFHVNTLYFGTVAQAGVVLASIFVIVGARWPGPVRRIAEGLSAFVPLTLLFGIIGLVFGRDYVYPWIHDPLPWKAAWLNVPRLVITDIGILAVLTVLTGMFLRASYRPALYGTAEGKTGIAKSMTERWTANWKGEAEEEAARAQRLKVLAPIICLVYAFGYSMLAFDQVMSLTPTWFSNLFGAYFAWGGILGCVTATTILFVLQRNHPSLEGLVTKERLHDLGKMIFAFSIFWMYLFFAQYLVIWYGNLPEETQFFATRLGTEFLQKTWYFSGWSERIFAEPWVVVSLFAWFCIWVIPFWFLLGQRPKRTWWFVSTIAAISTFGFWIERNVLIWPSLEPSHTYAFLGWIQVGVALGFLGLFALSYIAFTRIFPGIPREA